MQVILNNFERLGKVSPIDQVNPISSVSSNYQHVNTQQVISKLQDKGFYIKATKIDNVRKEGKQGFQRHLVRLTHKDLVIDESNTIDINILNSHDTSCAYRTMLSIYRALCFNIIYSANNLFYQNIRHNTKNDIYCQIDAAVDYLVNIAPRLANEVKTMQAKELTRFEMLELRDKMINIRLKDKNIVSIDKDYFITAWRYGDDKQDLYSVFNRIQEKLLKPFNYIEVRKDKESLVESQHVVNTRTVKATDALIDYNKQWYNEALKIAA